MKLNLKNIIALFVGALFGFALSRAGATDYNAMYDMFMFRDIQLYGVMGVAVLTVTIGIFLFKKSGLKGADGKPIDYAVKPEVPGMFAGAVLFGIGWAFTGACPGTSIAQLGEGKLTALITVGGMLFGSLLHGIWAGRKTSGA